MRLVYGMKFEMDRNCMWRDKSYSPVAPAINRTKKNRKSKSPKNFRDIFLTLIP